MTDPNKQEESSSFFGIMWYLIHNVLKNVPGISYFMRKTNDVIEAGKVVYTGDLSMAGAHILGYDEMLSVKRDERCGSYEKAARLSHLGFSGAIESVADHLPRWSLRT